MKVIRPILIILLFQEIQEPMNMLHDVNFIHCPAIFSARIK